MTDGLRGVLFDKDGTIIDFNKTWLPRYWAAANYLAGKVGQREVAEQLMIAGGYIAVTQSWQPDCLLASGSNDQILATWERHLAETIVIDDETRKECIRLFAASDEPYAAVLDDMDGYLKTLRAKSMHLGVATMDDESTAHATLKSMQLSHHFEFVCGADSGYGLKPEPGMVLAFCEQTNLTPAQVVMVGDSPRDLLMGQHAGVALCVGVLTGAHDHEALNPIADHVIDDIGELTTLL